LATVIGSSSSEEAKIGGMTPAVLSLSGRCEVSPLRHPVALLALGILDEEAPLGPLHEHDEGDHGDRHDDDAEDQEDRQLPGPAELQRAGKRRGQFGHDAGENDQRDAVADAARGDLLAQPHQEDGAAGQRDHGADAEEPARIYDHIALALEPHGDAVGLHGRQNHRPVAGVLVHLAPALLALLLELFEVGRDRRHQLHDDRRPRYRA
jgi:hypothetical protein